MSDHLNLRLDFVYKEMTRRIEGLDTNLITLDTQVSQTAEAMKIQEALVKGKAVERESVKTDEIDRYHHDVIDRQQQRSTERHQQASSDRQLPMACQVRLLDLDAHCLTAMRNPSQTSERSPKVELNGFHKGVKRVPKDMSFEVAYHKYRHVNIMAIDTAELLGLKMEPSQDSFIFVDNSKANSAGMIKNVKVEIGECIIHVDFHAADIKSGKTSPLLFGRAFMATEGTVCDLKKNKMCLINVDETVFYEPVEKKKSKEFISCIEMFEDLAPPADSNHESAKPA
ncbi:hypothetical protein F2Q68_00017137 [Brassica cretica]|uniref:Aspartic peptidase DDI1-type domain-containing protein n=1 Tax=Brassica cretica TaxID=69181 RepID=A0A8S9HTN6_BRACR|nr:hypothetical protein F2Q68_00017137 [Brassica cretica]